MGEGSTTLISPSIHSISLYKHTTITQSLALNGALLLGSHFLYHRGLAPSIAWVGRALFAPLGARCVRLTHAWK